MESRAGFSAICCDSGSELTSYTFTEWCRAKGIQVRFITLGKPDQNAFVKRFKQTCRHEVLTPHLFDSVKDARQVTLGWVARHNEIRGCTTRWESCRRRNTCEQLLGAETRSKSAYLTGMLTVPLRLNPLGARKVLGPTEGRRRWARWRTTRTR